MRFFKNEVVRLFSIGFVGGALVVGAPIGGDLLASVFPAANAATTPMAPGR